MASAFYIHYSETKIEKYSIEIELGYYHVFKNSEVNSYNITRDFSVISGPSIVKKEIRPAEASLKEREMKSFQCKILHKEFQM